MRPHRFAPPMAALLAAIALAPLAAQSAETADSPVQVIAYDIHPDNLRLVQAGATVYATIERGGHAKITFANTATTAATNVLFRITSGDRSETVADKGYFSTGSRITHDYSLEPGLGAATVRIESVTFSDGSHWTRS